jgi:hypothetical protein
LTAFFVVVCARAVIFDQPPVVDGVTVVNTGYRPPPTPAA